jgi:hypothetical protein
MIAILSPTPACLERMMARDKVTIEDFGIPGTTAEFTDLLATSFNDKFHGEWTIDDLVQHPREAMMFCDRIREGLKNYNIPDDFILRSLMNRRKNPV